MSGIDAMNVSSAHKDTHSVAIIGAGIVGLAHAWAARVRGDDVTVYERDTQNVGASIRNFGLGLVLGQPVGELRDLALRSRSMWLEFFKDTGCWHKAHGSLTVARTMAELNVIELFQQECGAAYGTALINAAEVAKHHAKGLAGLYSNTEIALESRHAIPALANWLATRHGVKFAYDVQVNAIDLPKLHTSRGVHFADQAIVCSGHDFKTLYPQHYAKLDLKLCALQMLRVANPGIQLAPTLMTGLSTLRYEAYTECHALTAALAVLRTEVQAQTPALLQNDIHLIIQQVGDKGDLLIGDSHVRSTTVSPFNQREIDNLILGLAENLLGRTLTVLEQWQGVYASGPAAYEVIAPAENVLGVVMTGGTGMSLSFALAEKNLAHHF